MKTRATTTQPQRISSQQGGQAAVLLYLATGEGAHLLEARYSLFSFLRWVEPEEATWRVVVLTDRPAEFASLPVTIAPISEEKLQIWIGEHGYYPRCKLLALARVLDRYGAPTIFVDSDTVLRRSPEELLRLVGPGRSVMHKLEGFPSLSARPDRRRVVGVLPGRQLTAPSGRLYCFPLGWRLWNSGVIGLHPVNRGLINDMVDVCDGLSRVSDSHIKEQVAVSHVLAKHTCVRTAERVVEHYWDRWTDIGEGLSPRDCYHREARAFFAETAHLSFQQAIQEYRRRGVQRYEKSLLQRVGAYIGPLIPQLSRRRP